MRYTGAWELVTNPPLRRAVRVGQGLRVRLARRAQGVAGRARPFGDVA